MNNPELVQKLKEFVENIDIEDLKKYLEEEAKEQKKGIKEVGNKKYFSWLLEDFLLKCSENTYDSESFLYRDKNKFTKLDEENESKICWIEYFLEMVRKKQRAQKDDDFFPFEGVKYYFRFNGKMFMYCLMIGQGSVTTIRQAKEDESFTKNINLDKYFEDK